MAINRKILKHAGSTVTKIQALSGENVIQERELLLATDTGELFTAGTGNEKALVGRCIVGDATAFATASAVVGGRFFFNTTTTLLYVSNGTEWKATGAVVDLTGLATKVTGATSGHFAGLDAAGNLTDSGYAVNDSLTNDKTLWTSKQVSDAIFGAVKGLTWQSAVLTAVTLTPPASPKEGDRYLINGVGTGVWAGKDGNIAEYISGAWKYTAPVDGMALWTQDTDEYFNYNGTAWIVFGAGFILAAGDGIEINAQVVTTKIAANSGLTKSAAGNAILAASTSAISLAAAGVDVKVDASSIVKDGVSGNLSVGSLDFGTF